MTTEPPAPAGSTLQRSGPLPAALRPLGALEPVYRWAVARRNAAFDRGERVWRAPVPVISVGNVSVGGTGKTPVVSRLARELLAHGRRPVIAMRGYKKRGDGPSDEEAEYLDTLSGVRVLAAPDRAAAIAALADSGERFDCVLLDDGFQHRFVARDLDVVLLDATRSPFDDRLLPAGWLREPVESLRRADAVVLTRADRIARGTLESLARESRRLLRDDAIIAACAHRWGWLDRYEAAGDVGERAEVASLARRRVFVVAGIGNPAAFRAQAESFGAQVVGERPLPDHAAYTPALVRAISRDAERRGAEVVLTTAKDWVKARRVAASMRTMPWVAPRVEIEFLDAGGSFDADALPRRVVETASRAASALS